MNELMNANQTKNYVYDQQRNTQHNKSLLMRPFWYLPNAFCEFY